MPFFDSDGLRIHYEVEGEGPPLVMIHGFTSSIQANWYDTNWVRELRDDWQLILIDCRGHGESDKPHEAAAYERGQMGQDVINLMDHLGVETAHIKGYSMGAAITIGLLFNHQERFRSAVLGGMGAGAATEEERREREKRMELMAGVLESRGLESLVEGYRQALGEEMPESVRQRLLQNDAKALAACARANFGTGIAIERLSEIKVPVLSVVGSEDEFVESSKLLEERIPRCRRVVLEGHNHLSAVPDRRFKEEVKAFLREVEGRTSS